MGEWNESIRSCIDRMRIDRVDSLDTAVVVGLIVEDLGSSHESISDIFICVRSTVGIENVSIWINQISHATILVEVILGVSPESVEGGLVTSESGKDHTISNTLTNGSGRIVAIGIVNHTDGARRSSRARNIFASPDGVVEVEIGKVVGWNERAVWAGSEGRWSG